MKGDTLAAGGRSASFYPAPRKSSKKEDITEVMREKGILAPEGEEVKTKQVVKPVKERSKPKKLVPLGDRIIVKRDKAEEISQGGILLTDSFQEQEKPASGEILAVGPGRKNKEGVVEPLEFKVGEFVLFGKYAGHEVDINGTGDRNTVVLKEEEVIGRLVNA